MRRFALLVLASTLLLPGAVSQLPDVTGGSPPDLVCMDGEEVRVLRSCPSAAVERAICVVRQDLCEHYRTLVNRVSVRDLPFPPLLP